MRIDPPPDEIWVPRRSGFVVPTTVDLGSCRIEHRMWFEGGLLTDFVLVQQVPVEIANADSEEWEDILRVDCCHGEVHAHRLYMSDPTDVYKVLKEIRTPEDLSEGAELAETLIYGEWESHLGKVGR